MSAVSADNGCVNGSENNLDKNSVMENYTSDNSKNSLNQNNAPATSSNPLPEAKNVLKTESFSLQFVEEDGNSKAQLTSVDSFENIEIIDVEPETVSEGLREVNKAVIGSLGYEQKDFTGTKDALLENNTSSSNDSVKTSSHTNGISSVEHNVLKSESTTSADEKSKLDFSVEEDTTVSKINSEKGLSEVDNENAINKINISSPATPTFLNEKEENSNHVNLHTETNQDPINQNDLGNENISVVSLANNDIDNINKTETETHVNNTETQTQMNKTENYSFQGSSLSTSHENESDCTLTKETLNTKNIVHENNVSVNQRITENSNNVESDTDKAFGNGPSLLNRSENEANVTTEVNSVKKEATNEYTEDLTTKENNEKKEATNENTEDLTTEENSEKKEAINENTEKGKANESDTDEDMPPLEPAGDSKSLQGNETENLPTKSGLVSSESLTTEPSTNDNKEPPTTEPSTNDNKEPLPEWLDILGNGLLKKKVLEKGLGEETRPVAGDLVHVRCEGKLDDGTIVDKNSCLQLILSDEDVIAALDLSIALMQDKEIALVDTDARYAYGILGRPDYVPKIPPNAHIVYEVEILSVEPGKEINKMSPQEMVLYGDKKRARGNDLYARGDYNGAINAYKRGLKYLNNSIDPAVLKMKIKCLNNLSAAQIKVKAYGMALISLDGVLHLEPKNVKAIFRKGKCLVGLNKDEEALRYIKEASMLDPKNKIILQELTKVRASLSATQKKEKEMYQRMFNSTQKEKDEDENDTTSYWPYVIGSVLVASIGVAAGFWWHKHR